ncbi:hypothetical protein BS297_16480 [Rhodococcus erythropolis]|uniref:Uncharacterized protein n=1 Tax=Rhodococcus erythropolis TaxID=1833 RepID=A0A5N5E224_RHOER|nr:hypothetical protein BS297_16480 [Rhodococcus erythropolis]
MQILHQKAPNTAAEVRALRSLSDKDAERATAPWTAEFREFISLRDGQNGGSVKKTSSEVRRARCYLPAVTVLLLRFFTATVAGCSERH